jgi:hypothetical protein
MDKQKSICTTLDLKSIWGWANRTWFNQHHDSLMTLPLLIIKSAKARVGL